jgi:hypothetical protein
LDGALRTLKSLVDEAHRAGYLPSADSREEYRQATEKVSGGTAMALYRRLVAEMPEGEPLPEDLWLLVLDPVPLLADLGHWAGLSHSILESIETRLADADLGVGRTDTEELIAEFRLLAEALDNLVAKEPG